MKLPNKPRVLASTYNPISNSKMISFLVDFPTVLLAELRTHRILTQGSLYEHSELVDFNLSANSARAIPHNKYLEKVLDNPYIPIWTKQQSGMSGKIMKNTTYPNKIWDSILYSDKKGIIDRYEELLSTGIHKQNANRLLAPFAYTTCIISGTEWDNFFNLRCPKYELKCYYTGETKYLKSRQEFLRNFHPYLYNSTEPYDYTEKQWQEINKSTAQPEFQVIAEMLYDLYQEANWKESKYHIPYEEDIKNLYWKKDLDKNSNYKFGIEEIDMLMKISASMCAKLSYNTQENVDTLEKHLERANMLIEHKHSEPFSHQAIAMNRDEYMCTGRKKLISRKEFDKHKDKYDSNNYSICTFSDTLYTYEEYGWCYNLNGFISQRFIIENW